MSFFLILHSFCIQKCQANTTLQKVGSCADEFFETTEPFILKFLPRILHILSYFLDLNQVKILFFTILFFLQRAVKINLFFEEFRPF